MPDPVARGDLESVMPIRLSHHRGMDMGCLDASYRAGRTTSRNFLRAVMTSAGELHLPSLGSKPRHTDGWTTTLRIGWWL